MTMEEFLSHCVAQGGNWASMIMSGIKECFPDIYAEMPDDKNYSTPELLDIIYEQGVKAPTGEIEEI